jgi:colanic acid/amylovoran biosynthesis glycosyltransferase
MLPQPGATRPRLLVVASTCPVRPGDGTPSFVWDLAEQEARAFEVVLLVPRVRRAPRRERVGALEIRRFRYFPARWEDLADGAILENLRARPSRWLQVVPLLAAEWLAVRRLVRSLRPDLLHAHWLLPQGLVARWAAPAVPLLLTTHGADVYALKGRLARALQGTALRRAALVTAVNQDMRRRLLELGASPEATVVAPMGADVRAIRAAMGSAPRRPDRLLFVGRMVEKKGVQVLLEALRQGPDGRGVQGAWSLDLVGDGPLRPALESSPLGRSDRVRWLGTLERPALARALAGSGIVVVPSVAAASGDQDGLPVVLLEAMAAGCAVVASRLPGIAQVVSDGRTGLLVPPGDAPALGAAIARLLADGDLRARLGAAARAAADAHSVEAAGRRYLELLQGVLAGAAAAGDGARRPAAPAGSAER